MNTRAKVEELGPFHPYLKKIGVAFNLPEGQDLEAAQAQLQVFADCFAIYLERNVRYKDNWRKMGWKGQLVRIKERVDRLWDNLWNKKHGEVLNRDLDDAHDLINFAAFLIRGAGHWNETTAEGEWKW
jgi:hypothetical protein